MTARRKLYLLFVFMAFGGSALRAVYPYSAPLHDLAHALFDAIAVAGVLGFFIELTAQRRLIGEVASELLGRIAGRHLPRSLQTTIEKTIAESHLVMHSYERTYHFTVRGDGYVDIRSEIAYDVVNHGPHPADYQPRMSEEIIHDPRFVNLSYGIGDPPQHVLDESALAKIVQSESGGRAQGVIGTHKVLIPSARDEQVPPACTVRFTLLTRTPVEYTDVVAVGRACDGMRVRAENLPDTLEFTVGGANADKTGQHEWTTNAGLIDGQHLRCWWRLKEPRRTLK
jgi:hypothetical protein